MDSLVRVHAPVCSQAPLGQGCCCCKRCGIGGCDLKVLNCGCCMHTRCCPLTDGQPMQSCPICGQSVTAIKLLPMAFDEIDQAQKEAAQIEFSNKRGKKRQNATIARLQPKKTTEDNEAPDLRTGRWTNEETAYCDKLIQLFEDGQLPIPDGIKLNDFLAAMLKSKQARLTKKMKNAKLSARLYARKAGFIVQVSEAAEFSQLETDFFASIKCNMERSEIRFHMQKEWRELFSNYCVALGQKLDADEWLSSVEEMDRRASLLKDAARMARRKIMMGYALSQDSINPQQGVFIDPSAAFDERAQPSRFPSTASDGDANSVTGLRSFKKAKTMPKLKPLHAYSSPFVGRVIQYIQRHNLPFEHVDAWVPSFIPVDGMGAETPVNNNGQCRLCFAGCGSTDMEVPTDGSGPVPISAEVEFDLMSFGLYSQKFSFDVGCGLPGRVYSSGVASWEQGITNAPSHQFERSGGAKQWGIQTVLGVPIASPNVGRVVVLFYSRYDRERDDRLVNRIIEELTKLMPAPQWKLVVDVGAAPPLPDASPEDAENAELLAQIQTHMPADKHSPLVEYLPGFTSIRLLLSETRRSVREDELLKTAVDSFKAYKNAGRNDRDATWMTARDFMAISKNHLPQLKPVESVKYNASQPSKGCAEGTCNGQPCGPAAAPAAIPSTTSHQFAVAKSQGMDPSTTASSGGMQFGNVGLPSFGNGVDFSYGLSPALQPIMPGNAGELPQNLAPLGLSASQLAALLQSETGFNFNGL